MKRIHLYFKTAPRQDRFIPGDRHLLALLKKTFKKEKVSGIGKVFYNLVRGFEEIGVDFDINLPFHKIRPGEPVVTLGDGRYALEGYNQPNNVIAGIGLMTHPSQWPELMKEYPVAVYLQHCAWAKAIYAPYYGEENCGLWAAGIDTERWAPQPADQKTTDILIYNKLRWNHDPIDAPLSHLVQEGIARFGLSCRELIYGQYTEAEYLGLLRRCRALVFLCEHESQGFALCEALSMNVPVLAWDPGMWLDPNRFQWQENEPVPATSVPFFDARCGMRFQTFAEFEPRLSIFWEQVKRHAFNPRDYILENLTLKKSAEDMLEIIQQFYP